MRSAPWETNEASTRTPRPFLLRNSTSLSFRSSKRPRFARASTSELLHEEAPCFFLSAHTSALYSHEHANCACVHEIAKSQSRSLLPRPPQVYSQSSPLPPVYHLPTIELVVYPGIPPVSLSQSIPIERVVYPGIPKSIPGHARSKPTT